MNIICLQIGTCKLEIILMLQWLQDTVEKSAAVMLSEDEDSESEISEFDVFDEANDIQRFAS